MTGDEILAAAAQRGASVLGFGISNVPLTDFLLKRGISVTVYDSKKREEQTSDIDAYKARGVRFIFGEDYLKKFVIANTSHGGTVLFRTPGMHPDLPEIKEALSHGAILTSEMKLFYELCPSYKIGITGSDGKTTTATLVYELLRAILPSESTVALGGNIGTPLLPRLDELRAGDYAVTELSSFQLMTFSRAPETAIIVNISPNHLNWHKDMDEYIEAKAKILGPGCKRAVLNIGDETTRALADKTDAETFWFIGEEVTGGPYDGVDNIVCLAGDDIVLRREGVETFLLKRSAIKIPGRHNTEHYMAALAALYGLFPTKRIVACADMVARSFGGVAHRLELVREEKSNVGGRERSIRYYNSSIDSTPSRTAAALSALPDSKIVLICGGYDKHVPYTPLTEAVAAHKSVVAVVLTGASAQLINDAFDEAKERGLSVPELIHEPDFDTAVRTASAVAHEKGADTVLLSPACASFDAFQNFAERGQRFRDIVNNLLPLA